MNNSSNHPIRPEQLTFVNAGDITEVFGPADADGFMSFLGHIDHWSRNFIIDSNGFKFGMPDDSDLAREEIARRINAHR